MPLVYYVSDLEKNGTLDAERLLRLLGLSGKLSGFYYTVYMLEQVREKPECILLITKRLYRQTAQHFHTSSGCVERNLRTLVQACWRQPTTACWNALRGIRCHSRRQIRSSLICWQPTSAAVPKTLPLFRRR